MTSGKCALGAPGITLSMWKHSMLGATSNAMRSPPGQLAEIARRLKADRVHSVTVTGGPGARQTGLAACEGRSPHAFIPAGSIDTALDPPAAVHVYVASKAPWDEIVDALPQYPEQPPPALFNELLA